MLKLNQNYSDYTDETDENYPEGKAINASSSESFDGTPLLAEFMNDINAAHIAMYKKAYGNTDGISGGADTQMASQFADAVAKYTDDKVKSHADERGLADGVHGATSAAASGQIASRDEFGRTKVADPVAEQDAANKRFVESASTTGNAGTATRLQNSKTIDGMGFDGSANINHFGVCDTAAATQEKTVAINGLTLAAGTRIAVLFTNGNTCGTCVGTDSNVIEETAAPTLNVNNTGAKTIYVGGEPAGEGFVNEGEIHEFIYDGTKWHDLDAVNIYAGENTADNVHSVYRKQVDRNINQMFWVSTTSTLSSYDVTLPIPYSDMDYLANCTMNYGSGSGYPARAFKRSVTIVNVVFTVSGNPRTCSLNCNGF